MASASGTKKKASERWALPVSQARSRATREKLLAAAEAVFAQKGYDGAKISDIAEEAGCSVGSVYFRFKDKDALFFAIAEEFIEDSRGGLENVFEANTSREQIVRSFVTRSAANFRKHRGLFRAIVERGFDHPLAMKAIFEFRDRFAAALEKALQVDDAGPVNIRAMTQMIYGFLIVGILNKEAPTRINDTRAVNALADACIAYLNSEDTK
jgi:AcrR family transcriptional regulator